MFGSAVRQPLTKKKRTKAIFVSVPFKHKFSKRITGQLIAGEVTRITQKSKRIPREPVIRFGAIGFVKDITKPLSRDLIKTKKGQKAITLPSRKLNLLLSHQ